MRRLNGVIAASGSRVAVAAKRKPKRERFYRMELIINGEKLIYWACDLKRVGDFPDEANSENAKIREYQPGWRSLLPLSATRMAVHRDRLGEGAHVFGIMESVSKYCDEHFKTAFKAAKLGPLTFTPA